VGHISREEFDHFGAMNKIYDGNYIMDKMYFRQKPKGWIVGV
jgi:hypothetical protein